jgi:PAS domain S-box-containing protein
MSPVASDKPSQQPHDRGEVMTESLTTDLFGAIGMVVLEREDGGSFRLRGTALDWFKCFCPDSTAYETALQLGKHFTFLENFLFDADDFWRSNLSGTLKSGLWIESDPSGKDCALEATAVSFGQKKILLIRLCWMAYTEKQRIIQKGRELGLEYHRIARLEEALQRAQIDLKERIKRRTAKLSKANELLKQEIEERKRAEEGRTLLATAIEHAAESIIITDPDGTIQYVNPAFELTTGYTREEAIGRNPRILRSGKHDEAFYRTIWDRLARGDVWSGRLTNRKKDGSFYEVDETISPVFDAFGKIINYVAVKRDVTQEVKLEKQLHHAQKMEAIGTLAGGIAHDFNNILSAIIGYSELATKHVTHNPRLQHSLEGVLKAANRARELVSQILTLARQSEQQLQPLKLGPVMKEALRFLRASLPATIEIREDIRTSSDTVLSDPTQIHQILLNLCTNAAHSMREKGGILEVSLTEADFSPEDVLVHPDLKPGPHLRLSVSDTGHGVDSSLLERIFDPYFTTKAPGEGTGMGLAVVQGIIRNQGGHIAVRSEVGKGSVFHVFLPKIADRAKKEKDVIEPPPQGNEHILFIDDEAILANLGKDLLESLGYSVVAITNSNEGLELFLADPKRFDLIITDQTMPEMTGMTLAQKMLQIRPDIPIILCTGYSEQVTRDGAREIGIREFLMKPLIMRDLARTIRMLLDG